MTSCSETSFVELHPSKIKQGDLDFDSKTVIRVFYSHIEVLESGDYQALK